MPLKCPCSDSCCDDPNLITPKHDCPENELCEECYISKCINCGDSCYCDL